MLQLNAEQVARLQALKLERDIQALADALARTFPAIPERLGRRYPLLVRHGVQRAAAHGLNHALCVARYLACWVALGAEFETKPGYAWARAILDAPDRTQGAKVFQLCRRSRDELARLEHPASKVAGAISPLAFDQAIAGLDGSLIDSGVLGSLFPGGRLQLGEACDLDAVDLRPSGPAVQPYRLDRGAWQRNPMPGNRSAVTVTAMEGAASAADGQGPALPEQLHLLSPSLGAAHARLQLRARAQPCCDIDVHPVVNFNGPRGPQEWRGRLAREVFIELQAGPGEEPDVTRLQPVLAAESAPQLGLLTVGACGLRLAGQPLGTLSTRIAVHAAEQHLMTWQRVPGPQMAWPDDRRDRGSPPAVVAIERDGVALESTAWRLGLEALDTQLVQSLGRLATAWERESGVTQGRLEAEPAVMCGHAGLTWGWCEAPDGMASPPHHRVAGAVDLLACRLNLRFSGNLDLQGSASRISLHCAAAERLQASWDRQAADADLPALLAMAQTTFRQPFVLVIESLARDEAAVVDAIAPVTGALVGSCGLRPRADGIGLQWFASLALEPVSVVLASHDPLLGEQEHLRPLLPAMKLLDWSLG